jgi:alkyl hydroperoxide reductase subunit AhpC
MRNVNLTNIYLHLIQFYGVNKFEVFSVVNQYRVPNETIIEFHLIHDIKVNLRRLNTVLEREIKQVKKIFVVQEDLKIVIYIEYYSRKGLIEYDFEHSAN